MPARHGLHGRQRRGPGPARVRGSGRPPGGRDPHAGGDAPVRDQQAEVRPRVCGVAERGVRAGRQVRRRRGCGRGARVQSRGRRMEAAARRAGRGQPGRAGRVRPGGEEHAGPDSGHLRGKEKGEKGVSGRVQQDIVAVQQRE